MPHRWRMRIGAIDRGPELDFSLDGRVLLFTALLALLTSVVFGLVPALQATRGDIIPDLKGQRAPGARPWLRHVPECCATL